MGRILFMLISITLMVVSYFNIKRPVIAPAKADSPLTIDPNTKLALAIAAQSLQAITGQAGKVAQARSTVENLQPSLGLFGKSRELATPLTLVKVLRFAVSKRANQV